MPESLFNKVAGLKPEACNFIKKQTLTQLFTCVFCQTVKNTFTEHLQATTSVGISRRCYNSMQSFLNNRHKRVPLNGQSSKWSLLEAGVLQDSISRPLHFHIYINDLPQGRCCNVKLFTEDTSLFSTIIIKS